MNATEQLLRDVYDAFNVRDVAAVLEKMHANVDWPNGMEGGRVHGHRSVREYWERQWRITDPHVEPLRIETDAAGLHVVTVHQVVRDLDGKVLLDRAVVHVYSFEDGLIHRMDIRETVSAEATAR